MANDTNYATFFQRLIAYIIDLILIGFIQTVFIAPLLGLLGIGLALGDDFSQSEKVTFFSIFAGIGIAVYLVIFILGWLYFALFESSAKQATPGKMALGIKVADTNGERLSFVKATLRYFGKYLSGMFMMIGYIIAGFTERRQALHDFIAGSIVLQK